MVGEPAIIVLSPSGLAVAGQLKTAVQNSRIHGLKKRVSGPDFSFENTGEHLRHLFRTSHPIIGLAAAGILIRSLAPELGNKKNEPPVICVAEDGSAVVPLLGGHNGANEMANQIAEALHTKVAITTAGDLKFGVALDDPPEGWVLANPEHAKGVMAAILAGASVCLKGTAPWLRDSAIPFAPTDNESEIELVATEFQAEGSSKTLVYHPKSLALGVGCERGTEPEELISLVENVLQESGLTRQSIAVVVSIDLKADEPAVHALASHLGVPARFCSVQTLNAQSNRLATPSEIVLRETGCPGVAEGAALAAAGPTGRLFVEKTKSKRATAAIACSNEIIDAKKIGEPRGRLSVVGIGPGKKDWRSPEATACLLAATDWVGYGLYIDLAADLLLNQKIHRFALGEEEKRVRHALQLADRGRDVALICSGDAGIYAMAALVLEVIELLETPRCFEIAVLPGISAFQAAAARCGAPIGHDFCAISLSDLLTPWETIEKRIRAAAEADFVIAFYNPKSERRTSQIARAIEIVAAHRPSSTPVITASNLGRDQEALTIEKITNFDPAQVHMLSLVIVGSSESRIVETASGQRYVYTPRGYEPKREVHP